VSVTLNSRPFAFVCVCERERERQVALV